MAKAAPRGGHKRPDPPTFSGSILTPPAPIDPAPSPGETRLMRWLWDAKATSVTGR